MGLRWQETKREIRAALKKIRLSRTADDDLDEAKPGPLEDLTSGVATAQQVYQGRG